MELAGCLGKELAGVPGVATVAWVATALVSLLSLGLGELSGKCSLDFQIHDLQGIFIILRGGI